MIDLDLIFFGNEIFSSEKLSIPHPRLQDRKFVLFPLKDVAEDYLHPVLKKTVKQLTEETKDTSVIKKTSEKLG